ncbi:hypothetical protein MTO96_018159 [Rhipicephalus appendiculatus]
MEDEPSWDSVSLDMANGYNNGAGSSGRMCRICREGDQKAELVSPCSCSGTMGFVHKSCLERWLNQRNVDSCELCGASPDGLVWDKGINDYGLLEVENLAVAMDEGFSVEEAIKQKIALFLKTACQP